MRRALLLAACVCVFSATAAAPADAAVCGQPVAYPGDDAAPELIANWMANGAASLNIPPELPVMAALVESGLKNLSYGDADSVGYFQMRKKYWDSGAYKGYATNPPLQLKWFTDQAAKVRFQYTTAGKPDPASTSNTYGVWIADIERPAEQYRGRYQLRLADARKLIAATCPDLQAINPDAPKFSAAIPSKQHPGRSGSLVARLRCPLEPCNASATVMFRLPGSNKLHKLSSDVTMFPAARRGAVRIAVKRALRSRIKQRLGHGAYARAKVRLVVADVRGAAAVRTKTIRIGR